MSRFAMSKFATREDRESAILAALVNAEIARDDLLEALRETVRAIQALTYDDAEGRRFIGFHSDFNVSGHVCAALDIAHDAIAKAEGK